MSKFFGMRSNKASFTAALLTETNEIGMLETFEVVEPHCQQCGEPLACGRCSLASSSKSIHPRPKERAAALFGASARGYGRPSAETHTREKQQRQWEFVQSIFRQAVERQFDCNILARAVLRAQTLEELQNMLH